MAYQFRVRSGHLILSTGAVGLPFDGDPRAAYTLLETDEDRLSATSIRVDYDRLAVLRIAESRGYPDIPWLTRVMNTGRQS